jgi:hypothetical protein
MKIVLYFIISLIMYKRLTNLYNQMIEDDELIKVELPSYLVCMRLLLLIASLVWPVIILSEGIQKIIKVLTKRG